MEQVIEPVDMDLSALIKRKKQEMIQFGLMLGLTDPMTVRCSQQLDNLLNQLQQGKRY
ncbi:Spo0E family sporulation regulatory protein-aspartic acid phosphatase [Virgibacillus xinjiangensis]|uniref:Spo0E family sporulation regulatory protein-aspartic acid phosphatase n=1 Tax=Virgibacillus xinjiangensis TaxID=393090 RepID=A0ABV7CYY2_9BACI